MHMSQAAEAAESFEQTLAELGVGDGDAAVEDPAALGRRAALLAASDVLWERHLGPLYSTRQVRELMGIGSRQAISERVKRRRLLSVPGSDAKPVFPAFQFTGSGRTLPGLGEVLDVFQAAVASQYTIASWFVTPEPLLANKTPAAWLRDAGARDRAVQAASRYAERLRH
jgi:hypothetical protein